MSEQTIGMEIVRVATDAGLVAERQKSNNLRALRET
jgi:hypothetical protein